MASVILTNTAAVTGVGTAAAANKLIKLDKNKLQTSGIKMLPYVDHVVVYAVASGAITGGTATLYWDVTGNHLAAGPFTLTASLTLTVGGTTYNLYGAIDRWLSPASDDRDAADGGCLYLALTVNAGTADVAATDVELYCHDNNTFTG